MGIKKNIKKSFLNTIIIGSIFMVFSLSFGGVVSLQDSKLNNFWHVSNLDLSLINKSHADYHEYEDEDEYEDEYEYEDDEIYKKSNFNTKTNNSSSIIKQNLPVTNTILPLPIVDSSLQNNILNSSINKQSLSIAEKNKVKKIFSNFNSKLLKLTKSDQKLLNILYKLNNILSEKIVMLENVKLSISDSLLVEKYEKRLLLFNELNSLIQEKILVYVDKLDLAFNDILKSSDSSNSNQTITSSNSTINQAAQQNNTQQAAAQAAAQKAAQQAAAQAAAQKAAQQAAAQAAAQKAAQQAAVQAAAQKAAQQAAAQAAAQQAAQQAAAQAAAQQAAQAAANTTTTAS